ncbi:MAG: hypothetical protein ABW321_10035, partial [Polyangiales bacterium]
MRCFIHPFTCAVLLTAACQLDTSPHSPAAGGDGDGLPLPSAGASGRVDVATAGSAGTTRPAQSAGSGGAQSG